MATLFAMSDIQTQVEQWGLWARGGLGALDCRVGAGDRADINDDEGLRFDKLVLSLKAFDSKAYIIIRRHYLSNAALAEIAIELKCSRQLVTAIHKNALTYLAGMMNAGYHAGAFGDVHSMTYSVEENEKNPCGDMSPSA